jgi:4-hydroxy-3-methylbut-2-enyl diphosphate reductase
MERQAALEVLCRSVDGVLVIGGRNSANTQRLLTTAQINCAQAVLIEGPDEIPPLFFTLPRIGLTAGASTPDEVIDAVEFLLQKQ